MKRIVALTLGLLVPAISLAEEEEEPRVVEEPDREVVRKRTQMDFSDTRIDGRLIGPEEDYIPGTGRIRFRNLIEFRQDFHEEVRASLDSDV
ncbi:MAG: hypothetical protein DIU72_008330 [Pseudomonadota bacterium]|nr:MAG: hypothetical protein DIU72_03125 [Pseudomonadota bacterium]